MLDKGSCYILLPSAVTNMPRLNVTVVEQEFHGAACLLFNGVSYIIL